MNQELHGLYAGLPRQHKLPPLFRARLTVNASQVADPNALVDALSAQAPRMGGLPGGCGANRVFGRPPRALGQSRCPPNSRKPGCRSTAS